MKTALLNLGVAVFNLIFVCGCGILIMIYGWGVEAKSWPVILAGYAAIVLSSLITGFVQAFLND